MSVGKKYFKISLTELQSEVECSIGYNVRLLCEVKLAD